MKTIIFTNSNPNQVALVNKISFITSVDAIVISRNKTIIKNKNFFIQLIEYPFVFKFKRIWSKLQRLYDIKYPDFPCHKIYYVDNINDDETLNIIKKIDPALVIVSGTNLIKDFVIDSTNDNCMIMNLHTGISPYIKGGPNCTNWCLAKKRFELIGNTIMELDAGIDSGNIIATEQTPLDGNETLLELHWKVMEHAHDLYIRAITCFINSSGLQSISQKKIDVGTIYYTKDWTVKQNIMAYLNFVIFYRRRLIRSIKKGDYKIYPLKCTNDELSR